MQHEPQQQLLLLLLLARQRAVDRDQAAPLLQLHAAAAWLHLLQQGWHARKVAAVVHRRV